MKKNKEFHISNGLLSIYFCLLLLTVFAVTTLAWIPNTIRRTEKITYENKLIISSLAIDVDMYLYNPEKVNLATGTFGVYELIASTYQSSDKIVDNISIRLNPGEKMSYSFTIKNKSEASALNAYVNFEEFFANYDPDLNPDDGDVADIFEYLSIHVTSPQVSEIAKLSDGFLTSFTSKKNLLFYNNLVIEPGQSETINWYIELSTAAGDEFWGAEIGFKSVFFGI